MKTSRAIIHNSVAVGAAAIITLAPLFAGAPEWLFATVPIGFWVAWAVRKAWAK